MQPSNNLQYTRRMCIALGLLALAVLLGVLFFYSVQVLLLIFAGILFAIFIRGINYFLFIKLLPLREGIGITIVLCIFFALLGAFVILLVPQLVEQGEKFATQLPASLMQLQQKMGMPGGAGSMLQKLQGSQGFDISRMVSHRALGLFATTLGALTSLFIFLFVGIYLSYTPALYRRGIILLVPRPERERAVQVLQALTYTMGHWLIGRFIGMLIIGVATYLALLLLGIPLALSLATLAGLLTFIPNIGPILSAVPAVLLGLSQSPTTALLVIVAYIVIQALESNLITPLVQQHEVSMPPVLILSSQVVLGSVLGILGLTLATPLTASVMVLVKMLYIEQVVGDEAGVKGVKT